jgi:hypothetical protein
MKVRTIIFAVVAVVAFSGLAAAQTINTGNPWANDTVTYLSCGGVSGAYEVVNFSEGSVWTSPSSGPSSPNTKFVWLTVYNPLPTAQNVTVVLYVDPSGATTYQPIWWTESVPPHARKAWLLNHRLEASSENLQGQYNVATDVFFATAGTASIATWQVTLDLSTPANLFVPIAYISAAYMEGRSHCVTITTNQ